ncbi:MAG: response regulator [Deltaproteobacteria bacterium]|nr:response regulator [Deltaproteobacteria bacterium]
MAGDKDAENRLKAMLLAAAHQWRTTFDAINDCVCLLNTEGNVLRCNKAMAALVGKPFSEVLEKNVNDLVYSLAEGTDRLTPDKISALGARHTSSLAFCGRSFDVTVDPIIDEKGAVAGCVHIMADTTERRQLEEKFNQAQKLEAIGKLAGGVAHDFNNILSVIMSYAGFLLEQFPQGAPGHEDALEIKKAGERAGALTRQLLAFSRRQIVNPAVLVTNDVINNLSKMLNRLIGENIQMSMTFSADAGNVFMDPSQLEQILVNLVVNAKDAMPQGGRVVVETRCARVDKASTALHEGIEPGEYVIISVTDTGVGMDKETQKKVFEPFFTTKPAGKGTGLGLSMVYGAVRQNHGAVSLYSEPGKGTTFRIYLKRVPDPVESEAAPAPAPPRGKGELLLLVEDEEPVRKAVRKMLEAGGYSVIDAGNGEQAVERYRERAAEVRLVISDMIMPDINGIVLAKKLREITPALKVLHMSGYTDEILTSQGLGDQTIPILVKPFERDVLLRRVRELLDR